LRRGLFLNFFVKITNNKVLMACVTAWLIAQILKIIITFYSSKKIDLTRLVGSGGMPSSHTSFVMALSTAIGRLYGWDSAIFAVSISFAFVVMYDAAGVRRAAGNQAKILNIIIEDLAHNKPIANEKLKELIGHTPKEVVAGAVLGILVANMMIK
jgi:acid phosphatase family membrane protein YuiD